MNESDQAARITIRVAGIGDLAAIVDLLGDESNGPGREGGDLAPYAAAFARIASAPGHTQVIAELDGQVVGTLQLCLIPGLTRHGRLRAQIEGVHTLSTLRGRGIGERLFAWAVQEARAQGAALVQVTSDNEQVNAHRFYEHLGFVPSLRGFTLDLTP